MKQIKEYTNKDRIYIQFILLCNELKKPCYVPKDYLKKMIKEHEYFPAIDIKAKSHDVGSWKLDQYASYGWAVIEMANEMGGRCHPITSNRIPTKEFFNTLYFARQLLTLSKRIK